MKIHGIRFYPQTVAIKPTGAGALIFHGTLSKKFSDLYYIFRPLESDWTNLVLEANCVTLLGEACEEDQVIARLRARLGSGLEGVDIERLLALVRGSSFPMWAPQARSHQAEFIPVFKELPSPQFRKRFHSASVKLRSSKWPKEMRALVHMWDDAYWQLFTTERTDINALIRAHSRDPKLKMYTVDFDLEYPEPGNTKLQPATLSDESQNTS